MFRQSLVSLFLAVISLSLVSQAQTSGGRDPQALTIISQALDAAGGQAAISRIQDFSATGTITYYIAGAAVTGGARIRGRGREQFRLDAALPEGTRSWAISGVAGQLKETNGNITAIPPHNVVTLGNITLPILKLADVANDVTAKTAYLGLHTDQGSSSHHIQIQRVLDSRADSYGILSGLTKSTILVDPNSLLIISVEDNTHPIQNLLVAMPRITSFSDYRRKGGAMVPFAIEQRVGGQRMFTLQLTDISFNVGLTDTDFRLGQ